MLQATRYRLHYEEARKSVRAARCSECHRPILDTSSSVYLIEVKRRRRVCLDCSEGKD